jgi:hypothetical protein
VNNTSPPGPPSEQSPEKLPKRQLKPVPTTLSDFLLTDRSSARRFVQHLAKRPPLPDDDLVRAHEIVNAQPSKIGAVVDLARAAAQTAPQPALLLRWCEQVVRSRDEALRGWALDPDQDARAAFTELLRWTFAAVSKKGDRSRRNTAEASLLIGLNLLLAHRSLAPLDALRSIASDAEGDRAPRSSVQSARLANKLLARAGVKQLLDLAQIAGLAEVEIASAEDARRQALSLVNDLRRDKEALEATQNILNAERQDIGRELGERNRQLLDCVDPRLGRASFSFARPRRPRPRDACSDRQAYGTLHVEIDETASPLMERLELNMTIDHNYVAHVDLHSTMRGHRLSAEIFDLEFTLTFPSADDHKGKSAGVDENADMSDDTTDSKALPTHTGGVCLRSNITAERSWQKVPGDLVTQYCPSWFNERAREYSDWQKQEWVYYKDCPYCHRNRYDFRIKGCGDSKCLWKREYPTVSAVGLSRIQP